MKPILVGSINSPFTRRLRLLFWNRLEHDFKAINYLENKDDAVYLRSLSPTNKIPVLLLGEQKVFDSRVIAGHVTKLCGWKPLSLDEENAVSALDAANESSVNLFMLRKGGMDFTDSANRSNFYLQRQQERIVLAFDYLQPWVRTLDPAKDWNFASMAVFSYIAWGLFREVLDVSKHPELPAFVERFAQQPGVQETRPR